MQNFALRLRVWFAARTPGQWLWLFILLSIALRWGSFFISVINHDESTYIVIADEMLRGERYFRDVVDTKPIGIFWIYAGLITLTGGSIPLLRLAASVVIGVGAWLLYLTGRRATGSASVGIFAGVAYPWMCSVFTFFGLSPNTEIFFNVFTLAAMYLTVAARVNNKEVPIGQWALAGFLLGLAFIIKPFAAAEAGAIGLFAVWSYGRARRWSRVLTSGGALFLAWCVPPALVYVHFAANELTDAFWYYSFEVSAAYPVTLAWYKRALFVGDYLLRFFPFTVLAIATGLALFREKHTDWYISKVQSGGPAGAIEGEEEQRKTHLTEIHADGRQIPPRTNRNAIQTWFAYLCLQFLFVTIVVLLTGKRFGHYHIQLHPVLALMAATWLSFRRPLFPAWHRRWMVTYTPLIICLFSLGLGLAHYERIRRKADDPAVIAAALRERLGPGETYFAINGWQIVYHLADLPVPTPYVHSSLLFQDSHKRAFRIDEEKEAQRIINDRTVTHLIGRKIPVGSEGPLKDRLLDHFSPIDTLPNKVIIYRRK